MYFILKRECDIITLMEIEVIEMLHQKTEWGHINWIHVQNDNSAKQSFSVGVTNILPGMRLPTHVHYGVDQFLYVLDGQGIYCINGVEKKFRKGMFFYIEADSSHETINTGDVPVREFLVASSVSYKERIQLNNELPEEYVDENINNPNMIYSAVEAIRTQLLKTISLPFTIYDEVWSVVIQNNNFSSYCTKMCDPIKNFKNCDCMIQGNFDNLDSKDGCQFTCKNGLSIFHYPIWYNGKQLGTIRGGHILNSDLTTKTYIGVYDFPKSSIIGIKNLLKQIASSISSYCSFNASRLLLENKDRELKDVLISNRTLENDLFVINDKVTNLRINHHFLFNTLNSMASMALTGDRYDLYNSIIDLSKMFRYTMTVDLKFVSLSSEIEYLETYLNLQRLRYGGDLQVHYEIENKLNNIIIPFNFLQPIVENAFIHGFSPSDNKKMIRIKVQEIKNRVRISIVNNGVPLNKVTLNRVNKGLTSNTGHGLSLIYEKLKSAYSQNFKMEVTSNENNETYVIMEIPIKYEENLYD